MLMTDIIIIIFNIELVRMKLFSGEDHLPLHHLPVLGQPAVYAPHLALQSVMI